MSGFLPRSWDVQIFSWIVFAYCVLCYGGISWMVFGIYAKYERAKINFYITDFWAVMLILAPTFFLLSYVFDARNSETVADWDRDIMPVNVALALLFLSQSAGMFFGRVLSAPREGEALPRQLDQAFSLLLGALVGLVLLIPVVMSFFVVGLALALAVVVSPYIIPTALILWKRSKR